MQPDALINEDWIIPDWPAPARVCSLITTRLGGVSVNPYASLNLGDHVGDDPLAVAANRRRLNCRLPAPPFWLNQVHGTAVVDAAISAASTQIPTADAAFTHQAGIVCGVMTADCLPVLLCDRSGTVVAAAHAGWRGLQAGILERTVAAMGLPGTRLLAYLGPAIGPQAFEVGAEVRSAFVDRSDDAAAAFQPHDHGKWLADLYLLARQRMSAKGLAQIYGGDCCTVTDAERFFSYRRDGQTGRMASLIWLDRP